MTLFFNVLMDPLDRQAQVDVQHIQPAIDLFRSMPMRRMMPHEVVQLQMIDSFVDELVRLAVTVL